MTTSTEYFAIEDDVERSNFLSRLTDQEFMSLAKDPNVRKDIKRLCDNG